MTNGFIPLLLIFLGQAALAQTQSPKLSLDLGSGVSLDTVLVKPGDFTQGSPDTEPGREADETSRPVTLTQSFYMGVNVITRAQFGRFVQETGFKTEAEKGASGGYGVVNGALVQDKSYNWNWPGFTQTDRHPVVLVTYDDSQAFCRWLSQKVRRQVSLPTEAQWEYACRAGTTATHYAEPLEAVALHKDNSSGVASPTGTAKANAWGITDLYGPVWQWCQDWYGPYRAGHANDPLQTESNLSDKPRRVLRGGSFLSSPAHARSAERYRNDPRSRNADNGFRIVCSATETPVPVTAPAKAPGYAEPNPPRFQKDLSPPAQPRADSHGADLPKQTPKGGWGWLAPFAILGFIVLFVLRKIAGFFSRPSTLASAAAGAAATAFSPPTGREMADRLSQPPQSLDTRFQVSLTDSGFYITGLKELIGRTLRYLATANGQTFTDDITFSPGPEGHFIYTGSRPDNVTIRVNDSTGSSLNADTRDEDSDDSSDSGSLDSDNDTPPSSSSHHSHPSAY